MHTDFSIRSFLPDFAIVNSAHDSDPKSARELCVGMKAGEVVFFDKVYVDFMPLKTFVRQGGVVGARSKENMLYEAV